MTTTYTIALNQNNLEAVNLTFTEADPPNSGTPLSLTGATINFVIKATKNTPDSGAIVILTNGSGITITSVAGGLAIATVPATALVTSGPLFWRCDVLFGGVPKTAGYGPLNVTPM